jgi:hypothetical protein
VAYELGRADPAAAYVLPLNLLCFGEIDRDVPRAAHNARRAIGMGVAPKGLEQEEKLLGKHGGSPVTKMSPAIVASYATWW